MIKVAGPGRNEGGVQTREGQGLEGLAAPQGSGLTFRIEQATSDYDWPRVQALLSEISPDNATPALRDVLIACHSKATLPVQRDIATVLGTIWGKDETARSYLKGAAEQSPLGSEAERILQLLN